MKKTIFLLMLLVSNSLLSQQTNLNKYQYIIVADKFDFLKEVDQYQTSSLTKFLLEKKGFEVFLSNQKLPQDLNNNRCLSLFVSVKDNSSMFTIKNTIEFKDCYGKVVYSSEEGKSKYKDYKKGYQDAIRNAYESMEDFEYSFNPTLISEEKAVEKEEIIAKNISDEVVSNVVASPKVIINSEDKNTETTKGKDLTTLYAQTIENGFQLVNTKPEVIFILLKTNIKDTYLIKDKNGSFYKKDTIWVAEYYLDNKLVKEEYQVKF
ncbi:hypothetical protein LPB03_15350 [Polaribacter vadi]|nr:hypothetical protein LPB03_15350 [Polaribacter vadi]